MKDPQMENCKRQEKGEQYQRIEGNSNENATGMIGESSIVTNNSDTTVYQPAIAPVDVDMIDQSKGINRLSSSSEEHNFDNNDSSNEMIESDQDKDSDIQFKHDDFVGKRARTSGTPERDRKRRSVSSHRDDRGTKRQDREFRHYSAPGHWHSQHENAG